MVVHILHNVDIQIRHYVNVYIHHNMYIMMLCVNVYNILHEFSHLKRVNVKFYSSLKKTLFKLNNNFKNISNTIKNFKN